jgi:dihydrofolate synthase/folylpolyglutamate synthase
LGTERIVRALELAGDPQRAFPSLLVGGTNGKGSTVAFASALLHEAGHCVGSTYSPHLVSYTERFMIDGALAGWDELEALAERLEPIVSAEPGLEELTFFELGVLLALSLFSDRSVDVAVLEVGMGGEFDATRAAQSGVAAIVSVDLDHCRFLGDTVVDIAGTKARMAPPGGVLVTTEVRPDRLEAIRTAAEAVDCQLEIAGRDFSWSIDERGLSFSSAGLNLDGIPLGLKGAHQGQNAACALASVVALCRESGLGPPSPWNAGQALQSVVLPGRLERVRLGPGRPVFVMDGAHNAAGAEALAQALGDRRRPDRRVWLYGAMEDKDRRPILDAILPHVDRVVCVRGESSSRFAAPELLAEEVREAGGKAEVMDTASRAAIELARKMRTRDEVLVAGSLYIVGDVRRALEL